jgi:hypothetical protein
MKKTFKSTIKTTVSLKKHTKKAYKYYNTSCYVQSNDVFCLPTDNITNRMYVRFNVTVSDDVSRALATLNSDLKP